MPYLIRALTACRAPVKFDKDVDWAAGEIRDIDDELYSRFANNPTAFEVLAGPGNGEVLSAALSAIGAAEGAGEAQPTVMAKEQGSGLVFQTVLTLKDTPVPLLKAKQGGGAGIYAFPEGHVLLLGALAQLTVTRTGATPQVTGQVSIGSALQNGATGPTQQDFVPATAFQSAGGAAARAAGALARLDGSTTPVRAFVNVSTVGVDGAVTVSGLVTLTWLRLGDY
jgi:hypothetical protein